MFGTRHNLLLLLLALSALLLAAQAEEQVKEDVIEIENKPQKVIRVSPLELPVKQDRTGSQMNSELFQIQMLRPGAQRPLKRLYMDSRRMRAGKKSPSATGEAAQSALKYTNTPELKAFPKQKLKHKQHKQLNLLLQQPSEQPLPIQMTQGPYPIYYVLSKTNGRFGKFPIKSFRTPAEFAKYLIKSKAEPIPRSQRYELQHSTEPSQPSALS